MTVPGWVQDAIFYQIFPDRFSNGDQQNDPPNVQQWGAEPTVRGFQGGDLKGIQNQLDYLADLGVNAIYLNPIFASTANHRYHTSDYFKIDPSLGSMEDFHALLEAAHSKQIRVVLDGVFNHSGRGFFAFSDILDNGPESRYKDWYHIHSYPVDAFSNGPSMTYEAWWGIKDLPKFNTDNPEVRNYIMKVASYWIEQGIDGWRLDVPGEIDDDDFWAEFRETVKNINPEAYLAGEIWEADPRWVGQHHFDGLMHYPLRDAMLDLLKGSLPLSEFANKIESFLSLYPRENVYAMYLSIGSHDTKRLFTCLDDDIRKVKLAFLLQFAYPGAPSIYYGDEIGVQGEKDPYNRRAFPWDQGQWNHELRDYARSLVLFRKQSHALRRGDFQQVVLNSENSLYAFARISEDQQVLTVINPSPKAHQYIIPVEKLGWEEGQIVEDALSQTKYSVSQGALVLSLGYWDGVIIKNK
jgi:neopullulanase